MSTSAIHIKILHRNIDVAQQCTIGNPCDVRCFVADTKRTDVEKNSEGKKTEIDSVTKKEIVRTSAIVQCVRTLGSEAWGMPAALSVPSRADFEVRSQLVSTIAEFSNCTRV